MVPTLKTVPKATPADTATALALLAYILYTKETETETIISTSCTCIPAR